MNENPYQSPLEAGSKRRPSAWRLLFIGCVVLMPICFLLGRLLIPPDDVAFWFSLTTWPVLSTLWGIFLLTRYEINS